MLHIVGYNKIISDDSYQIGLGDPGLAPFLKGNRGLGAREQLAYAEAINTSKRRTVCINAMGLDASQRHLFRPKWGRGSGFKMRVADHLEKWFAQKADLKQTLEDVVNGLWEQTVIAPMLRLTEENAPEESASNDNFRDFPSRATA
jgi:hypothetical protein